MISRLSRSILSKVLIHPSLRVLSTKTNEFYAGNKEIPEILQINDYLSKRHIGPDTKETKHMLGVCGVESLEALIEETVPQQIRESATESLSLDGMRLGPERSESQVYGELMGIAKENKIFKTYIGQGFHPCITPPILQRSVLENPAWYTSYTPYQAEISQGRLEGLLHYQTMISELTGLEMANASLLDDGSAAAESLYMCYNLSNGKRNTFMVDKEIFPNILQCIRTRAKAINVNIEVVDIDTVEYSKEVCGILVQNPGDHGVMKDLTPHFEQAHKSGVKTVVYQDIMSLCVFKTPGDMGADICLGSTQRFGIPMGFGGPSAAFYVVKKDLVRKMPGRMIGYSVDRDGNTALRMALQVREQHIKRERATSNICTAQALMANLAGFYGMWHGSHGLKQIARRIAGMTQLLREGLKRAGFGVGHEGSQRFDTIVVDTGSTGKSAQEVAEYLYTKEINVRIFPNNKSIGISLHEDCSLMDLNNLLQSLAQLNKSEIPEVEELAIDPIIVSKINNPIGEDVVRKDEFMRQDIFTKIHSENQMMRYLMKLQLKDYSLANGMIPLGSCTLKCNPVSNLMPMTWPEFSQLHPMVPDMQCKGSKWLMNKTREMLAITTGFAGVSLQPNSGAQGELTGLLVIKRALEERGEGHRNICLIPTSAHGTNPASCMLSGMRMEIVKCDDQGNINIQHLGEMAEKHKDNLAALMVTYPSTHGVFEEAIMHICDIIHDHGGLVYMDGANMNAQCGLTSPAKIGADICHLNLHKTFAMPHGGGGPGSGPVCCTSQLAPYLPEGEHSIGSLAAAMTGSAMLLPISAAYLIGLGAPGLTHATKVTIYTYIYIYIYRWLYWSLTIPRVD